MSQPITAAASALHRSSSAALAVCPRRITDLKPSPHNARTHSRRQIRQIADSIRTFRFTNPVLIDGTGTIIAGHGRVEAARLLGWTEVPTVELAHLTPAQVRAYIIADNRLAELAGWDPGILKTEFEYLQRLDLDFDLSVTGFEIAEIDQMVLGEPAAEAAEAPIDDRLPAVCQPGDLWLAGPHGLLCADARDAKSYDRLLGNEKADAIFTDAPYNVKIDGHVSGLGQTQHREFAMACGEMSEAEFTAFLATICSHLVRYSRDGSIHYHCMDWRHLRELLAAGHAHYTELKNLCAWVKDTPGMGSFYRSQHELILVFKNGRAAHRNNIQLGQYGRNRSNVWHYPGVNAFARKSEEGRLGKEHPTVKPVQLVADALLDVTAPGDLVLDAFLGSGTTLIAAQRIGRRCRAIELDPGYVDLAIRRWQRLTGDHAVHADSGERFDAREAAAVAAAASAGAAS